MKCQKLVRDLRQKIEELIDSNAEYGFFDASEGSVIFVKVSSEELVNRYLGRLRTIYELNKNKVVDYWDDAVFLDDCKDDGVNRVERLGNFFGLCGKLFGEKKD